MIIVRTPYRISFFGGGTDFREYYEKSHDAGVITTTIDKYCYISLRELPSYFEHKFRLCYSKIEHFNNIDEIEHPSARSIMGLFNHKCGLEIHYDGDVPAKSGLGSSSAFTVSLLKALNFFYDIETSKYDLASKAIFVEQNLNKEAVGLQDQVSVCYGGFNKINFSKKEDFTVTPLNIESDNRKILLNHCLLFYSGYQRFASNLERDKIKNIENIEKNLIRIAEIRNEASTYFENDKFNIKKIGKLLDISWSEKKELSKLVSFTELDEAYETGIKNGAYGGKILGAGGGGFMLFLAPPETHSSIQQKLKKFTRIKFNFEDQGSSIIFNNSN